MLMILIFYGYMASYSTSTSEEHKKFLISYADAVGELVLVAPEYEELAGQYSLYYYTFEGDFYENFDKALELLKDEKIVGILADHAFLSYQADKNTDFTLVSTPFLMYRFSAAVGLGVSDFDYKIINQAISSITDLNTRAELTDEYNLFVKDSKRVQKPINPEMAQGLFFILILISIIAILLSLINHPYFRSASWGNVCIKKTYLAESDYESATQRSEIGIEMKHSRSISEVALTLDHTTDFTDRDAALPMISDMREESLKLIRNATLALIMYEHNFINNVDKLIAYVVGESKKKVNVIEQMESLIQRIGKLSEE